MTVSSSPRCVAAVHAVLGEGPVWISGESALYWVDIKGRKIFRLGRLGELEQWDTPMRIGSLAPSLSGGFIAGTDDGIVRISLDDATFDVVLDIESELPDNRFNDGKIDRRGRFWAGSMDDRERRSSGSLYRIEPDLRWATVDEGYRVTNGPAFSASGNRMYHNDSARQVTYVFDIDGAGEAIDRRVFLKFAEGDGYPDGMTVDADDCLWIAFWDGWCVRRFSPEAELLETIELPIARPTSCAFGGENLERLYVTSASIGLDADALAMQPNAGGLFMMTPGVRGLPDVPFAG